MEVITKIYIYVEQEKKKIYDNTNGRPEHSKNDYITTIHAIKIIISINNTRNNDLHITKIVSVIVIVMIKECFGNKERIKTFAVLNDEIYHALEYGDE